MIQNQVHPRKSNVDQKVPTSHPQNARRGHTGTTWTWKIKKKTLLDFNSQAFCHSAPQLVTQLAMIWSGVSLFFSNWWLQHQIKIKYKHQPAIIFQATLRSSDHLAGPPSWPWAAAWAEILAIILSFSSLIVTAARFQSWFNITLWSIKSLKGTTLSRALACGRPLQPWRW